MRTNQDYRKRIVVITVGKTHSGKTTFARELEQQLQNSVVIDRDNQAEFINTYYKSLQPKQGTNTLKNAIFRTIVGHAVQESDLHLILCNANRHRRYRLEMLERFQQHGFGTVLVHFDLPDSVLQARIANSQRSTGIFRNAASFEEVLLLQQAQSQQQDVIAPVEGESDYLFVVKDGHEVPSVIQAIVNIAERL